MKKKGKKEVEVKKGGVHYHGGKLSNVRERESCVVIRENIWPCPILWSIVCDLLSLWQ